MCILLVDVKILRCFLSLETSRQLTLSLLYMVAVAHVVNHTLQYWLYLQLNVVDSSRREGQYDGGAENAGPDNSGPDSDGPIIGSIRPLTLSLICGCHGDVVGSRSCE